MSFLSSYYERVAEVKSYLKVLKLTDRLLDNEKLKKYDHEARIFRSGAMLVIYNAIEASARDGIQAIYDDLSMKAISFNDLHGNLKNRIIGDFKFNFSREKGHNLSNLAVEIVEKSFNESRLFSGNVDARVIKKQAKAFGINTNTDSSKTMDGIKLLTVKNLRNDLAHGHKSFSDASKDLSIKDIEEIAKYSLAYMEEILLNIETYIQNQEYLDPEKVA